MHINNTSPLLTFTSQGLYCPAEDVYLDPIKPVKKALSSGEMRGKIALIFCRFT
jgi:hypothetical protein